MIILLIVIVGGACIALVAYDTRDVRIGELEPGDDENDGSDDIGAGQWMA
jgi:hypothetical protein